MNGVMKMQKKTIKKRILAVALTFALIVPANVAGAKTQTVLETNVTEASEGCTWCIWLLFCAGQGSTCQDQ